MQASASMGNRGVLLYLPCINLRQLLVCLVTNQEGGKQKIHQITGQADAKGCLFALVKTDSILSNNFNCSHQLVKLRKCTVVLYPPTVFCTY